MGEGAWYQVDLFVCGISLMSGHSISLFCEMGKFDFLTSGHRISLFCEMGKFDFFFKRAG